MNRSHVWLKGLTPISERIVVDLQALSRPASGITIPNIDRLERQVTRYLCEFSSRQLSVSLNAIARGQLFEAPHRRRIVHMMCEQLTAKSSQLTLKDFALIFNALSKLGIKNEMFLTNSINIIVRKLRGMANSGNVNTSAASLLLDAYSRLGFYGDGTVIDACITALRDNTGKATSIDSLIAIQALARLPEITLKTIPQLDVFLESLLVRIDEHSHMIPAVVGISKISTVLPAIGANTCVKILLTRIAGELKSATFFRLVQFLNATSILESSLAVKIVNDVLMRRLTDSKWTEQCDDASSVAVLVISAITKINERLRPNVLTTIVNSLESGQLDPTGMSMLVNLCSCMNLELSMSLSYQVMETIPKIIKSSQSVSLMINALAKLDSIELLIELLGSVSDIRTTVRGMTEQGQLVSLLAIAQLADRHSILLLNQWISVLIQQISLKSSKCRESLSQLRLISVLLKRTDLLQKYDFMDSRSLSIVSGFHTEVLESLTPILGYHNLVVNHIDVTTGYEIDIFIDRPS